MPSGNPDYSRSTIYTPRFTEERSFIILKFNYYIENNGRLEVYHVNRNMNVIGSINNYTQETTSWKQIVVNTTLNTGYMVRKNSLCYKEEQEMFVKHVCPLLQHIRIGMTFHFYHWPSYLPINRDSLLLKWLRLGCVGSPHFSLIWLMLRNNFDQTWIIY